MSFGRGRRSLRFINEGVATKSTKRHEKMLWENVNQLCDLVRETSFAIHKYHRCGRLEKVYENALAHGLRKMGLRVEQYYPLTVYDEDGTVLGEYFADLFVKGCWLLN